MEQLISEFVSPFKIRRSQRPVISPLAPRSNCLHVVSVFRENFPVSNSRWKTHDIHWESSQIIRHSAVSRDNSSDSKQPELSFDRLQLSDKEYTGLEKRNFGRFIAREAVLDEEYWTAAWLRAEAHWESVSYMRHIDSYKRKYAEQEFYSLKRRCFGQDGNSLKCLCFVAVKKEEKNIRRTALNSVVGTLDLSIRRYIRGETYPGEVKIRSPVLANQELRITTKNANQELLITTKYAYISNVCVSKFARRQGIASNMLFLAVNVATSSGIKELFVHVNSDNKAAQELYKKIGFKIVDEASSPLSKDQRILMFVKL